MKQIHGAVQALECAIGFGDHLGFVEETEKRKKKNTRQIPQGQYAYCKYLEIILAGVLSGSRNKIRRTQQKQ